MDLVARPSDRAFLPAMGVGIIGRVKPDAGWGNIVRGPPMELAVLIMIVLIHPGPTQDFDGGNFPKPAGRQGVIDGVEQLEAIPPICSA